MMLQRSSSQCARRARAHVMRSTSVRHASNLYESTVRKSWLEENCGDVPLQPRKQDSEVSEMLRGGHALQVANANLLEAKLASAARGPATSFSESHTATLKELKDVEDNGLKRLVAAVEERGFRFRPSVTIPAVECSSFVVGTVLSLFGENVSVRYLTGVKSAIAEYYNDQIREIYAIKPDETELKDIFRATRDEELVFVDEHTPDALDPSKDDEDPVRRFASTSTKVLLQVASRV